MELETPTPRTGGNLLPRRWLRPAAVQALLLGLAACAPTGPATPAEDRAVLRIGLLPDRSRDELESRNALLVAYLCEAVGCEIELVVPESYTELVEVFGAGRLDLAWFGGLTFIQAESRSGAEPLVLRDVDLEFTSDYLVPSSAAGRSLADFAGGTLAFGPRLSTSGHLMPRYFLLEGGIDPDESFSEVHHSSGHDETAIWVRDGRVDVGVVNSIVVEAMLRDGRLDHDAVRILGRTPPYRNYVWAVPEDLDDALRVRLLDAFLDLDWTVPEQQRALESLGARAFLPASRSHFEELRAAARILGTNAGRASDG